MVFSDPMFIIGFLPASLLLFFVMQTWVGGMAAAWTLLGLSMVFYAYWSVPFLGLLLCQIGVNYAAGYRIQTAPHRALLPLAVVFNLGLLGYFKYRNFFLENVGDLVGVKFHLTALVVPLGMSIQNAVGQFMPMVIAENSLTAVKPLDHSLSPGVGFAVLCGYAALALAAGGWALARRDA